MKVIWKKISICITDLKLVYYEIKILRRGID